MINIPKIFDKKKQEDNEIFPDDLEENLKGFDEDEITALREVLKQKNSKKEPEKKETKKIPEMVEEKKIDLKIEQSQIPDKSIIVKFEIIITEKNLERAIPKIIELTKEGYTIYLIAEKKEISSL